MKPVKVALAVPQTKDGDGSVSGDGSRMTEKSYPGYVWKIKSPWFVDVGHEKDRRGTDFSKFSIWEIGRTDTIFPKRERLLKEQI